MGFLSDLGDAVSNGADAVADVADTVINVVAEVISDAVETVGNAIEDQFGIVADVAEDIPGTGFIFASILRRAGGFISGLFDVAGAFVKGTGGILSGIFTGLIRVIFGIISLDGSLIIKGFLDIVSGILGGILVFAGKIVSWVQATFYLQSNKRKLTKEEREIINRVFRESFATYNIRIVEGWSGIYELSPAPFTLGNTIYMKDLSTTTEPQLLVHECVHVWQYQKIGSRYATDAIGAQWFIDYAYNWELEIARGKDEWIDFNKESQSEFCQDLYTDGAGDNILGNLISGSGAFYDASVSGLDTTVLAPDSMISPATIADTEFIFNGNDHTDRAENAVGILRNPSFRLSRFIS